MPATDLVPCFYTGQLRCVERPREFRQRAELHQLKAAKLGKFVDNGKVFLFDKTDKIVKVWDGPIGIGNLLPFAKQNNYGDKLHYEMPHAGDRGLLHRHGLYRQRADPARSGKLSTRTLSVSSRNIFARHTAPELAAMSAY
jgi:hypothetical protein